MEVDEVSVAKVKDVVKIVVLRRVGHVIVLIVVICTSSSYSISLLLLILPHVV